jgi:hypothetical protein
VDTGRPLQLDVYGLRIDVDGDWPEVIGDLAREFWWFRDAAGPREASIRLAVTRRAPDFDRFGGLESAFVTPRNVVYQGPGATVVDYFGRAALSVDRAGGGALVEGELEHVVREAASNFLLSRIGEHLNTLGLTRVHALGLAGSDGAVAVTMPSGGGKSTLALRALRSDACLLLSEDSPLVDRHGIVHPFPLRIGVNPTDAGLVPDGHEVRTLERLEFHPKLALDVEAFADRVATDPQPLRHLVVGRRTLAREGRLEPLGRRHAVAPLLREAVVGLGVYQGMEFVLQRGWGDVAGKSGAAGRRVLSAAAVLRHAHVWRLWLGRDHESNWQALQPLL